MEMNGGLLSFKDKNKNIQKLFIVQLGFWVTALWPTKCMIPTGFLHHTNIYEFKPKYNYQK